MPQQQEPVFASSCVPNRKEFLPTFLGVVMEMESEVDEDAAKCTISSWSPAWRGWEQSRGGFGGSLGGRSGQAPGSAHSAGKGFFHEELTPQALGSGVGCTGWSHPSQGQESPGTQSIPRASAAPAAGPCAGRGPPRGRSGDTVEPVRSGQK